MKPMLSLILAALLCGAAAAQTYKWVDERGVVNYGEKPPAGQAAKPVDTRPGGTVESAGTPKPERMPVAEPAASAPQSMPTAAPLRGMDFDTFIRLQIGMTEGELLLRAGRPDHESVDQMYYDVVKSYYYYPTAANPFITVVKVRGGRIVELERTRKNF